MTEEKEQTLCAACNSKMIELNRREFECSNQQCNRKINFNCGAPKSQQRITLFHKFGSPYVSPVLAAYSRHITGKGSASEGLDLIIKRIREELNIL